MTSTRKLFLAAAAGLLYACATLQFIRFYVVSTYFYLNMPRYLSGRERLPFQERFLPILLMWPINHSAFLMRHLAHARGDVYTPSAATTQSIAFYFVSLVSFSAAAGLVYLLYRSVTRTSLLAVLVFPVFLLVTLWSYVIHVDANFSFPYDMPSLAFFAGGVLAIYTRRFLPLLLVVLFGTMNRETTLFLVGIYILDAASCETGVSRGRRFVLSQVRWPRVLLLGGVWCAVKFAVHYHFRFNDNSENFVRLWGNFGRLGPRLWPTLFNICGYLLPIVLVFRDRLPQRRFANYFYIFPVWAAVMFYTGVILEVRIWGELCPITAVAVVLLLEEHLERQWRLRQADQTLDKPAALGRKAA